MNNKIINIRVPENEFDALARYAAQTRRTKTEVVREFLRSLERRLEQSVSAKPVSARARPKTSPTKKPRL